MPLNAFQSASAISEQACSARVLIACREAVQAGAQLMRFMLVVAVDLEVWFDSYWKVVMRLQSGELGLRRCRLLHLEGI